MREGERETAAMKKGGRGRKGRGKLDEICRERAASRGRTVPENGPSKHSELFPCVGLHNNLLTSQNLVFSVFLHIHLSMKYLGKNTDDGSNSKQASDGRQKTLRNQFVSRE